MNSVFNIKWFVTTDFPILFIYKKLSHNCHPRLTFLNIPIILLTQFFSSKSAYTLVGSRERGFDKTFLQILLCTRDCSHYGQEMCEMTRQDTQFYVMTTTMLSSKLWDQLYPTFWPLLWCVKWNGVSFSLSLSLLYIHSLCQIIHNICLWIVSSQN